jgi:hypothetical protein
MGVELAHGGRRAPKPECRMPARTNRSDVVIGHDLGGVQLPEASQLASVARSVSLRGACVGVRFLQRDPCLWGAERATG